MKLDKITYAGHSAVLLSNDSFCLAIDPWLKDNPLCPKELKTPDRLNLIVLSHGHADHAGDVLRLSQEYSTHLVATYELAQALIADGYPSDKVVMMNKGGTTEIEGLKITLTHALHSSSYDSKNGTVYAGEACGVVVQAEKSTFYHAGDTCLFSDMRLIGQRYAPQVAFLPIGDHFTMGPVEAAQAAKLVEADITIPIHHSTFGLLTGTPEQFAKECHKVEIESLTLKPGQTHTL
jgi:L-ascorbate metabolism protein UlaG (beta-lactamase superfamily)